MNIKVLWIDDDYRKQLDVIGDAELDGIDLIPFESHEEGMEALFKDITGFHAVILDAKVKTNKVDTKTGLNGLRASRDKLIELNNKGNHLPYFIYTGQPDYMDEDWFKESYGDFYIKGIDNQRLLDDIKIAVEKKDEYLIQKEYYPIFEILEKYFDIETEELLNKILIGIKKNDLDHLLYFIQLRKILEKSFRILNKFGLLHDKCIQNGRVNLSESSLFLSGQPTKHLGVECIKAHFPNDISSGVWDIISICGTEAHTEEDLAQTLPKNSSYLFYSLTFRLLDILVWFDNYIIENSNYQLNIRCWKKIELIEGIIDKDQFENYFCGQHVLSKIYVEQNNKVGDHIVITEEKENIYFSKRNPYQKFATKFHKKKN
jgi:hypothetical protein